MNENANIHKRKTHMVYVLDDTEKVKELFADWEETLIYSCLQKVM